MTELTRRITSSKAAKTDAPFANGANIASLISWMGVPNVVIVLGNLLTRPSTRAAAFCRFAYIAEGFGHRHSSGGVFLISLVAFEESASILFFNVWLLPDMECPHE